jgi:hypothetical protein
MPLRKDGGVLEDTRRFWEQLVKVKAERQAKKGRQAKVEDGDEVEETGLV